MFSFKPSGLFNSRSRNSRRALSIGAAVFFVSVLTVLTITRLFMDVPVEGVVTLPVASQSSPAAAVKQWTPITPPGGQCRVWTDIDFFLPNSTNLVADALAKRGCVPAQNASWLLHAEGKPQGGDPGNRGEWDVLWSALLQCAAARWNEPALRPRQAISCQEGADRVTSKMALVDVSNWCTSVGIESQLWPVPHTFSLKSLDGMLAWEGAMARDGDPSSSAWVLKTLDHRGQGLRFVTAADAPRRARGRFSPEDSANFAQVLTNGGQRTSPVINAANKAIALGPAQELDPQLRSVVAPDAGSNGSSVSVWVIPTPDGEAMIEGGLTDPNAYYQYRTMKIGPVDTKLTGTLYSLAQRFEAPLLVEGRAAIIRVYLCVRGNLNAAPTPDAWLYRGLLLALGKEAYHSPFGGDGGDGAGQLANGMLKGTEQWAMPEFQQWWVDKGHEAKVSFEELWKRMQLTMATLLTATKANVQWDVTSARGRGIPEPPIEFAIYGVDVLITEDLRPLIIEMNVAPYMGMDGDDWDSVGHKVKVRALDGFFDLLGIGESPAASGPDQGSAADWQALYAASKPL